MSTESAKKALAEEIWLNYFNKYLLERGAISETAYRRMRSLIRQRSCKTSGKPNVNMGGNYVDFG